MNAGIKEGKTLIGKHVTHFLSSTDPVFSYIVTFPLLTRGQGRAKTWQGLVNTFWVVSLPVGVGGQVRVAKFSQVMRWELTRHQGKRSRVFSLGSGHARSGQKWSVSRFIIFLLWMAKKENKIECEKNVSFCGIRNSVRNNECEKFYCFVEG